MVISEKEKELGLNLIAYSDCTTCHKISESNIGPSYKEIANKYSLTEANIDVLAKRTIKGGSGIWGNVPMTPHPDLSIDDARMMMKYILSLKNK